MRALTTSLEVAGYALLTAAAFLVSTTLGVAVAGAFLVVLAYGADRRGKG